MPENIYDYVEFDENSREALFRYVNNNDEDVYVIATPQGDTMLKIRPVKGHEDKQLPNPPRITVNDLKVYDESRLKRLDIRSDEVEHIDDIEERV